MPARVAAPPGRIPEHDVIFKFGLSKPENKIPGMPFVLININTDSSLLILSVEQGHFAVIREF